jgi:hypothetical protein
VFDRDDRAALEFVAMAPALEDAEMEVLIRGDDGWYATGCVLEHIEDFGGAVRFYRVVQKSMRCPSSSACGEE